MVKFEPRLDESTTPPQYIVTLSGSADIMSVDDFQRGLDRIAASQHAEVVLDLASLNFICSLAIGGLVTLQKVITRRGGHMRLTNVQPPIYQCLHHARLDEMFTIVVAGRAPAH